MLDFNKHHPQQEGPLQPDKALIVFNHFPLLGRKHIRKTELPTAVYLTVTWMLFSDKKHMTVIFKQCLSCQSNQRGRISSPSDDCRAVVWCGGWPGQLQ